MIRICLTKGSAEGVTEIAAYSKALGKAGLINMNLIRLSSVLPHGSKIIKRKPDFSYLDYGKKLYLVISEVRESKKNLTACAGLGWIKEAKGTGHGIIVEVQGNNERQVRGQIEKSLRDIIKNRKTKYKKISIVTESIICNNKPVCALVALVFKLEGWV